MIKWSDYCVGDHRVTCPVCGTRPNVKNMGITVFSADYGLAHCFACSFVANNRNTKELTPAERKAFAERMDSLRRDHAAEQRKRQLDAAAAAAVRWAAAREVADHPYLRAKGVLAHGLRVEASHTLLVPMRDIYGHLHGVQSIAPDGSKRFMPGARTKTCYHSIGKPSGRLVICEGYATGATIHEDTGHAVAVTFNAGNLRHVAIALRTKFPRLTLVIAADDDWQTEGNPGLAAATDAARAVGGLLAVPDFTGLPRGPKDTDFNDLHRLSMTAEERA